MSSQTEDAINIIYGADKIAAYLGIGKRQVYHACATRSLPIFRIGATVCARPATLLAWIVAQEEQAGTRPLEIAPPVQGSAGN